MFPLLRKPPAVRVTAVVAVRTESGPLRIHFVLDRPVPADAPPTAYEYQRPHPEPLLRAIANGIQTTEEAAMIVPADLAEELRSAHRGPAAGAQRAHPGAGVTRTSRGAG